MRKIIFILTIISLILLWGACSHEDVLPTSNPDKERTLSLTAFMPGSDNNDPATRVGIEQQDKTIVLSWETTDILELAFVQGATKIKATAKVLEILDDGKRAIFDITIPDGIEPGEFDLYGVYGGGGLDASDPTKVILTKNPSDATSLKDPASSIQSRKDVMLYFASKKIKTDNPTASVKFNHLGSLFSITLINVSSIKSLSNLAEARLIGVGGNSDWAFNAEAGGGSYNLLSEKFENQISAGNYISFKTDKNNLSMGDMITFWAWYPPLPEKIWPELKLELIDTNGQVLTTSINSKPARTTETTATASKSYYFYAVLDYIQESRWDPEYTANLKFTPTFEYTVSSMGDLANVLGNGKENIAALILKGEINKSDFDVMRDELPNLRYLDLAAVTCDGNAIPEDALRKEEDPFGPPGGGGMPGEEVDDGIAKIILPSSITSIGARAFSGLSSWGGSFELPIGVTSIGAEAYRDCSKLTGSLNLAQLTTLGERAFFDCKALNGSLTLPAGLTSIPKEVFLNCGNLTGPLQLPSGVTSIGNGAFQGCSRFVGLFILPTSTISVGSNAFEGCSGLTGSLNLAQLTKLGKEAFSGCYGFKGTLTLPTAITRIEDGAFNNSYFFTGKLEIPVGVKSIGINAFYDCHDFTGTLILPEGLESIQRSAFNSCSKLSGTIIFPISLVSIGQSAFNDTRQVEAFKFPHTTPVALDSYGASDYNIFPTGATVKVPAGAGAAYRAAKIWQKYNIVEY